MPSMGFFWLSLVDVCCLIFSGLLASLRPFQLSSGGLLVLLQSGQRENDFAVRPFTFWMGSLFCSCSFRILLQQPLIRWLSYLQWRHDVLEMSVMFSSSFATATAIVGMRSSPSFLLPLIPSYFSRRATICSYVPFSKYAMLIGHSKCGGIFVYRTLSITFWAL